MKPEAGQPPSPRLASCAAGHDRQRGMHLGASERVAGRG
jgi:hypothetical protein